MKAGLIINVNATGARSRWRRGRIIESAHKMGALVKETSCVEEMEAAVREFREKRIELILAGGGDGTIFHLVTFMRKEFHNEYNPVIFPLPLGASNVTVKNLGMDAGPLWLLWSLRRRLSKGAFLIREVGTIKVTDKTTEEVKHGFIFVAGLGYKLTLRYKQMRSGMSSVIRVTSSAITEFMSYVLSPRSEPPDFLRRIKIEARVNGETYPYKEALIVLAGVLPNPILWFTPFYKCDGIPHGDCFYLLINSMKDRDIAFNMLSLFSGRKKAHESYSGRAYLLDLQFNEGYAVDGELFNVGAKRTHLIITPGRPVRMLFFRDERMPRTNQPDGQRLWSAFSAR